MMMKLWKEGRSRPDISRLLNRPYSSVAAKLNAEIKRGLEVEVNRKFGRQPRHTITETEETEYDDQDDEANDSTWGQLAYGDELFITALRRADHCFCGLPLIIMD